MDEVYATLGITAERFNHLTIRERDNLLFCILLNICERLKALEP